MVSPTFCVSGAALAKAGANRSTSLPTLTPISGEQVVEAWIVDAESVINTMCRYNWTDVYSTLDADVKRVLSSDGQSEAGALKIT